MSKPEVTVKEVDSTATTTVTTAVTASATSMEKVDSTVVTVIIVIVVIVVVCYYYHILICSMQADLLLAGKSPNDSRSASSLESYDSDLSLKLSDSTSCLKPAAKSVVDSNSSCSNTTNTSHSSDVRGHNSVNNMPALVSCDFTRRSTKTNGKSASDTTGLGLSCSTTTHTVQTDTELQLTVSSTRSTSVLLDKNARAQNISETVDHLLRDVSLDCDVTRLLKTADPVNSVTHSECGMNSDSHNSLSLNANNASSAVKDSNTAGNLRRLCVNVNSAFESRGVTATITSPTEDFQSIYASHTSSLTPSAVTGGTSVSEPETTHRYPDLDSMDAWLEFSLPGKSAAQSLCVSRRTAWYVDKADHLYYSSLNGPGLTWISVHQPTQQISCSPSALIVWRVYNGSAFSAIGRITGKFPAGTEWREVAREVAYVAVDDNVVW